MDCPQCGNYAYERDLEEFNVCYDCVLVEEEEYERSLEEIWALKDCYS